MASKEFIFVFLNIYNKFTMLIHRAYLYNHYDSKLLQKEDFRMGQLSSSIPIEAVHTYNMYTFPISNVKAV